MIVRDTIYIDGAWVPSEGSGTLPVVNSTTEETMGTIPDGTPADVDGPWPRPSGRFPSWSKTSMEERAKYCSRIAEGLAGPDGGDRHPGQRRGRHGQAPRLLVQAGLPYNSFNSMASIVDQFPFEERGRQLADRPRAGRRGRVHHPVELPAPPDRGQGGAWPSPPAAPSCSSRPRWRPSTPSSWPRSSTTSACRPASSTWSPASGPVVGEAIASHPDVDMVSFTGSTRAGKRVGELLLQRSARSRSNWAARAPTSSWTTPTSPRRSPTGWASLPQLGPDVLGPDPHARPPVASWPRWRGSRPTAAAIDSRRPLRRRAPAWARWYRTSSGTGCGATSRRASTRAPS